jgi:dihydropyrimidinase
VCSPPLREDPADQAAIWQGVKNGTFTILSSDHAPSKYNHPQGKLRGLAHGPERDGRFRHIPNGLPGVETRLPLLFSGGVVTGRITPQRFVELTATNPAKLYGFRNKGIIAPGYDADIVIWHRQETFEPFILTNEKLHHAIDYTPFDGFEFRNWPRYTLVRGKVVFSEGKIIGDMGYGRFVKRQSSLLPVLRDGRQSEWRLC